MANVAPPKPGGQLGEVPIEISKAVVADRLEAIFPGLRDYATKRYEPERQRRQAIWARRHPDTPMVGFPPEALVLSPDYVLDYANAHARIGSDHIGEDKVGVCNDAIARRVLRNLWTLQEDVLTVSHLQRCFRLPASHLLDFVIHGAGMAATRRWTAMIYSCVRVRCG